MHRLNVRPALKLPPRGVLIALISAVVVMFAALVVTGTMDDASQPANFLIRSIGVFAAILAIAWSAGSFFQLRKISNPDIRWRAASGLLALGCASMFNSMFGMFALMQGWNNDVVDFIVQTSGLFTYLAWPLALMALPARRALADRRKLAWVMEVLLIVTTLSAAGWFFLVAPIVQFEGRRFAFWLTCAYPLANVFSIASIVAAITLGGPYKSARGMLMIAIAINVLGDVVQMTLMLRNEMVPMLLIHDMWIASSLIAGLAALRIRFDSTRPQFFSFAPPSGSDHRGQLTRALVPALFLVALVVLVVIGNWMRPQSGDVLGLNIGGVLGVAFALVRMLCLIKDNAELTKTLADTNAGLDNQVRERTRELMEAKETLEQQQEFLRSVIDALPGFVVVENAEGSVTLANVAAAKLFGRSVPEMQSSNFASVVEAYNPGTGKLIEDERKIILEGQQLKIAEREVINASNERRVFDVTKTPIAQGRGQVDHVLIVGNDVTVRKEAERSLIESRDAAERSMQIKSQFLATISHEIRTPLNGIVGFSDMLLAESLPPHLTELAQSIHASSQALLSIISNVLDVSRLENGQVQVETRPTCVASMCSELIAEFRNSAETKGIGLRVDVRLEPNLMLHADADRLRQVIHHLLSNAIKFTEAGTVSLDVDAIRRNGDVMLIRVQVKDSGIGIPSDLLATIFDSFAQVDGSMSRKYGGAGLGLALCKHLVKLMGGEIHVESEPGAGSVFSLDLPLKVAAECANIRPTVRGSLDGLSVLVVEDNLMNQKIVTRLLERQGCQVSIASNGLEAVDWLLERRCDVVLMDCQMPIMDGLEATRRIRTFEAPSREVPIIAVTANAMDGDREKCLAAGMDDYVPKPIKVEELTGAICRLATHRQAA